MEVVEISQGDEFLGFIWFCRVKECDECADYDESIHGIREPRFSKRKRKAGEYKQLNFTDHEPQYNGDGGKHER